MTTVTFDILAYAKKMKQAGFTETQAEAQAEALSDLIDNNLASKQDILRLEGNMERIKSDLMYQMKELESRMTLRLGSMIVAGISILAAMKFFA